MIEDEGEKWKVSKERRDMEITKAEEREMRLRKGQMRGEKVREIHEKKTLKTKITENSEIIPEQDLGLKCSAWKVFGYR